MLLFFVAVTKIWDRNNSWEKSFILAHDFKEICTSYSMVVSQSRERKSFEWLNKGKHFHRKQGALEALFVFLRESLLKKFTILHSGA
jgi:hypothetical protein